MVDVSLNEGELAATVAVLQRSNSSLVQQGPRARHAFTRSRFNWGLLAAMAANLLFWVGLFQLF